MSDSDYREVLSSDVVNDGMYLELHDPDDRVVAVVFRSDQTGEFEVHLEPVSTPSEVTSAFIERAKRTLEKRNG